MSDTTKKIIVIVVGLVIAIALIVGVVVLAKSNSEKEANVSTAKTTSYSNESKATSSSNNNIESNNVQSNDGGDTKMSEIDFAANAEKQFAMPEKGEQVATIKVKDFGDIKVKFFPEVAPKAVENFVTHAQEGYYDGTTFHRIMEEFMIQGGDPLGDGTGGESIWGTGFGTELDYSLVPYRGSLCMAMSSLPNSIGSQFFITQANFSEQMYNYLKSSYPVGLLNQYRDHGGYLSLYMQYTVFGQVYEGMDVVDAIAKVEKTRSTRGELSIPLEEVVIETIEVGTY